jgi:hypothetical protein
MSKCSVYLQRGSSNKVMNLERRRRRRRVLEKFST